MRTLTDGAREIVAELNADASPGHVETAPAERRDAPLLSSIAEAAACLSVGRTTVWALLERGELRSVKIGARRLIPRAELEAYVDRLMAAAGGRPAREGGCPMDRQTLADLERRLRRAVTLLRELRALADLDAVEDDQLATAIRHVAAVAAALRGDADRARAA